LKALLIQSCIEGFAETVLIGSSRLDELVFDPSERKEPIESALSEFRAIVGAEDPRAGVASDRVFKNGLHLIRRDRETDHRSHDKAGKVIEHKEEPQLPFPHNNLDEIGRPHMPGKLWLGKECRDMRTDLS